MISKQGKIYLVFWTLVVVLMIGSSVWMFNSKDIKDMTPEQVVIAYSKAASKGDIETIKALHDPEVWDTIGAIWEQGSRGLKGKIGVSHSEISADGSSAKVDVYFNRIDGPKDTLALKKTDKGWKISY